MPLRIRPTLRTLRRRHRFAVWLAATLALGAALGGPVLALADGRFSHPRPAPAAPAFDRHGGWTKELRLPDTIHAEAVDGLVRLAVIMAVLMIAGAAVNVATLLLARASARRHETAVRAVVGATPLRLARRALAEGALVGAAGGAAALAVGLMAGAAARRSWPADAGWLGADFPVLHWPAIVAAGLAAIAILAAALPAAVAARRNLHAALTVGARATAGPGETLLRKALAVLQFACSATLLTGAVLVLGGGIPRADAAALGFDPRDTLAFAVRLPDADAPARAAMQQRMLAAASGVRGVKSATAATPGAWIGLGPEDRVRTLCDSCFTAYGYVPQMTGPAQHHAVSPGWFRSMGVAVISGRELRPDDGRAVLINRVFAATYFPRDPIDHRLVFRGWWSEPYTIVGIVGDARAPGPATRGAAEPAVFVSTLLHPPRTLALAIRTIGDPAGREPLIRRALAAATPGARVDPGVPMQTVLDRHRAPLRWFALLLMVLAAGATVAAAGGLYQVMAFAVARRTREIGVRMATGATERHVLRLVMGEALRITLLGAIVGSIGAITVARMLEDMFYGVDPFAPTTYVGVAAALTAVTLIAAYRPAVRAIRVHPDQALRAE
ncbi:FtsX-like permease family protein [Longimicrobium sp.]|uniref:FtsX-like permease family protein n=1 Tax=Longimicrobium sp. TaxID=2029185 RepID=UPI003B3BC279